MFFCQIDNQFLIKINNYIIIYNVFRESAEFLIGMQVLTNHYRHHHRITSAIHTSKHAKKEELWSQIIF